MLFRADAGIALGSGHVMRCLALAAEMERRGWAVRFAINRETLAVVPALGRAGFALRIVRDAADPGLSEGDDAELDLIVIDHYALDERTEGAARRGARRVMVIDDLANRRHAADVLLDQTLDREPDDYRSLVPSECRLLLGPDYALLRPQFAAHRQLREGTLGTPPRVLVSLGATDPERTAEVVVAGLDDYPAPLAITVVTGAAAPHLAALRAAITAARHSAELLVDVADMAALLARVDVAIGGAGTSAWERCCVGLPSLVIELANNQHLIAAALQRHGAARNLGPARDLRPEMVTEALGGLLGDRAARQHMAEATARICDGGGVARTLSALAAPIAVDGGAVTLRAAAARDGEQMLAWQQHPATRRYARNPQAPRASEHARWFAARLADPRCLLNIVLRDGAPAGVLRLDPLADASLAYEVSVLTAPDHYRRGIGRAALMFGRALVPGARLKAVVLPGNAASDGLFRAAGYRVAADGALWSEPVSATRPPRPGAWPHAAEQGHA